MLTIKHTESERTGLFEAWIDDVQVGELTYRRTTPERMIIDHTRVFEGFEGQGIAKQLVMAAVDFAQLNNRTIIPLNPANCGYSHQISQNPSEIFAYLKFL